MEDYDPSDLDQDDYICAYNSHVNPDPVTGWSNFDKHYSKDCSWYDGSGTFTFSVRTFEGVKSP